MGGFVFGSLAIKQKPDEPKEAAAVISAAL
jgi:hypothetical protein